MDDIKQAERIYGTTTPLLKVKTKRTKPNPHYKTTKVPPPLPIAKKHKGIKMCIDNFYVIWIILLKKTGMVNFLLVPRLNLSITTQIKNEMISDQTKYQTRELKLWISKELFLPLRYLKISYKNNFTHLPKVLTYGDHQGINKYCQITNIFNFSCSTI